MQSCMAIFTLASSSVLRKDDQYSVEVIGRTIDVIVPVMLQTKTGGQTAVSNLFTSIRPIIASDWSIDWFIHYLLIVRLIGGLIIKLQDTVRAVLELFVDALPHMPVQRRQFLFQRVLKAANGEENLWILVVLLMNLYVMKGLSVEDEDLIRRKSYPVLCEFLEQLFEGFSLCTQVTFFCGNKRVGMKKKEIVMFFWIVCQYGCMLSDLIFHLFYFVEGWVDLRIIYLKRIFFIEFWSQNSPIEPWFSER